MANILEEQKSICQRFGVGFTEIPGNAKIGIADNVKSGQMPIHGMRQKPAGEASGWYIWAGDETLADPASLPLHAVENLGQWCPAVLKFLGLPPGWRFIVAKEGEDVWVDPTLL